MGPRPHTSGTMRKSYSCSIRPPEKTEMPRPKAKRKNMKDQPKCRLALFDPPRGRGTDWSRKIKHRIPEASNASWKQNKQIPANHVARMRQESTQKHSQTQTWEKEVADEKQYRTKTIAYDRNYYLQWERFSVTSRAFCALNVIPVPSISIKKGVPKQPRVLA